MVLLYMIIPSLSIQMFVLFVYFLLTYCEQMFEFAPENLRRVKTLAFRVILPQAVDFVKPYDTRSCIFSFFYCFR